MIHKILFFLFLFSLSYLYSQELREIDAEDIVGSQHLANRALILEDINNRYTADDILNELAPIQNDFFQDQSEVPYMDFTSSTFWMKLNLINTGAEKKKFYIELARPLTNTVNLYVFDKNKNLLEEYKTGDDLTFKERPYLHRKFIFPLSFPASSKQTLVIQTKSDGEILELPIKFWEIESFTQFNSKENFFLGFYYGFLALVFILFSFFGFALKQRLYIFFVGYVFILGLFQFSLDGFSYQYLWPNSPWFGNHAILIFAALSLLALLAYADQFLEFYNIKGWFYKLFKVFYLFTIIGFIASFFSGEIYELTFPILNGISFLFICSFFLGIYIKYKAGYKIEIPVAIAFLFLWLGAIFFVLSNVNIIESEFLANNALKLGSAGEITLLSLAMASRYRKTQNEAVSRLEEINELKSQQTEKLERQVQERTLEISEQNKTLITQNQEIINSINYAERLQTAILPSSKLMEELFNEYSILYLPKDIVSGDFYWVEATEHHTFFAVADCTGHGVPGALVSVVGNNALNRCINELKLTDPGEILDQLRNIVELTFKNEEKEVSDGMDICLCVWDNHQKLEYAGAFNPLYVIRKEELTEIKGNKQPIGNFLIKEPFTTHKIKLKKGDSVYLFSDGYPDQFGGPKRKKLKYSVFKEYLLELNKLPSKETEIALKERFHKWRDTEEQVDDVCILNIRF